MAKVMFSGVSVCPQGGPPYSSPHTGPQPQPPCPDIFQLIQIGTQSTVTSPPPTGTNVFIMKRVKSASGRSASFYNAFFFSKDYFVHNSIVNVSILYSIVNCAKSKTIFIFN